MIAKLDNKYCITSKEQINNAHKHMWALLNKTIALEEALFNFTDQIFVPA